MTVSAKTILALLKTKHDKDTFVSECKTGASQYRGCLRMDAWAMKPSWANPLTIAYEIKVSRADFLGDDKWSGYLTYCNQFYFVCPNGVIAKDEVPPDAGLLYVTKNGARLITKKKAPYREVEIPEDLWRYILMCRSRIVASAYGPREGSASEYWHEWMKKKEFNSRFGWHVSASIRKVIETKIIEVEKKQEKLNERLAEYKKIEDILIEMGIDPNDGYIWGLASKVKSQINRTKEIVPPGFAKALDETIQQLEVFRRQLEVAVTEE